MTDSTAAAASFAADDAQPYFDAIVSTCAEIEAWLAGSATEAAALDALLAQFAPHFTMVGTDGAQYDRASLRALFVRLGGHKPGLRITFSAMRAIACYPGGAAIGYDEHQHDAAGALRSRRSTAVLERDAASGAIRWTHLQETWIGA
ncbi:polyketide cyclase [Burkholderia sp. Ac-20379]|uniref:polyketide cyclase n=1 Tax=Burkholderia sp. Ac-20379 TaxID=2703900 RepID=UPI00197E4EB2|nr:polyketide cyclase [Burkholderia sp. Ac-20379]MBN3724647.1 polyketide cyclase [Burkholderia sp. Ac-20379]